MSLTKKSKIGLIILFALISLFVVGCKKTSTPVNDIAFNIGDGEQIVLMVGQTLDVSDHISIKPHYATNKSYTLESFDQEVIKIDGRRLLAVGEGTAVVKVVSGDNALKEDAMTVVVRKTKTTLSAPNNLKYNSQLQLFTFDTVPYAASYTLKLNDEEFELGNSNVFNLADYDGAVVDTLISAQVKANAPTYTYALEDSSYTDELKVYQAGKVSDVKIENGILTFRKTDSNLLGDIYLNNNLFLDDVLYDSVSLLELHSGYANKNIKIEIQAVVSDEIKSQQGEDVEYFNSTVHVEYINVLDVPVLNLNSTTLSWQNIAHCAGYAICVYEGQWIRKGFTYNNHFDLTELNGYSDLIATDKVCKLQVVPVVDQTTINVGKTSQESTMDVSKLATVQITCNEEKLVWDSVDQASVYAVVLSGNDIYHPTSTVSNYFSMDGYPAGNYSVTVQTIAGKETDTNGVRYISSDVTSSFEFNKLEMVDAVIENYELKISNLANDKCSIKFDNESYNFVQEGNNNPIAIDLSDSKYEFVSGLNTISLRRKGTANSVSSNEVVKSFVQLEKVNEITIENGVASVDISETNANAIIKWETMGGNLAEPKVVQNATLDYNTEDSSDEETFLSGGSYTTKVYVCGDGSSTFAYRENGVIVSCASINFEVLSAPEPRLEDGAIENISFDSVTNATAYNIFKDGTLKVKQTATEYGFELNAGSVRYAVQAIKDGSTYLDSEIVEIVVTRLITPSLKYNNQTDVLSKIDLNDAGVSGYVFTINGEIDSTYDFVSKFNKLEDVALTLQAMAGGFDGDSYYLNSGVFELELSKISNVAEISVDNQNNMIISTSHAEEYDLDVEFDFNGSTKTFLTSGGFLVCADDATIKLPYSYRAGVYTVALVDENHNARVQEMNANFKAKVKFVKESSGEDEVINSEQTSQVELALVRISNVTSIGVNNKNQLVISPTGHLEEHGLILVVNNGADIVFKSNGGKLISDSVELNYEYDLGKYYIDLIDSNYNHLIDNLSDEFTVKVKYTHSLNATISDTDSLESGLMGVRVLPVAQIEREGQNLVITKVKESHTYQNYGLLINDKHLLRLDITMVSISEMEISINVEYIYSVNQEYLEDVNAITVVALNSGNETDPTLSLRGETIYIAKADSVALNSTKDNDRADHNNSAIIKFNSYETSFKKEYIVEIGNQGETNQQVKRFTEPVDANTEISFEMDSISDIEGTIYISAYVATDGSYVRDVDGKTIEVFNSNPSNEVVLTKIGAVKQMVVSNSEILFLPVANAAGYDIYKVSENEYVRLNSSLVTTNRYEITSITGETQIVIKTISKEVGGTNSSYSDSITINKLAAPTVEIKNGKFYMSVNSEVAELIGADGISIIPEVSNAGGKFVRIDMAKVGSEELKLDYKTLTLIAEPYLFLMYNGDNLLKEDISVQLRVEYNDSIDGVYYLNSNIVEVPVYGMFEPTNVNKTVGDDTIEKITWQPSVKNIINGGSISAGYVFKIEHTVGDITKTYYSNDAGLKYCDTTSGTSVYESYPELISGNSAVFPYGYDMGNDGTLEVVFAEGLYKIYVQAIPKTVVEGYNLCSSQFTQAYEFEILPQVVTHVNKGKVAWDNVNNATEYEVKIYDNDGDEIFTKSLASCEYDFSDASLKNLSGIYKVTVKAKSNKTNVINGITSNPLAVYRLPEVSAIHLDDGHLIISATKFFTKAEIELVDNASKVTCYQEYDNASLFETSLSALNIASWEGFSSEDKIEEQTMFPIKLSDEVLSTIDGGSYSINITLYGNTNDNVGFINSSKATNVSSHTVTKLKASVSEVSLGVVKYSPDSEYSTLTNSVYDGIDFGYAFNNATSSAFWHNTAIYIIEVVYSGGKIAIYAVDYYSLITAINNGTISSTEYEILDQSNGLYAMVKYPYGTDKTLNFVVYNQNEINLKNYDFLSYYVFEETMENGASVISCAQTLSTLDLTGGGSFTINITQMGGDTLVSGEKNVGYLTATTNNIQTFVRYSDNTLTSNDGVVEFNNLLPTHDGKTIDNPIYQIVVTPMNSSYGQVFFLYYTTEEDAIKATEKIDKTKYSATTYVKVEANPNNQDVLWFDLTQHIQPGSYKANIRTLAGLGNGKAGYADYLINAKEPTSSPYIFYKPTETSFGSSGGVLIFDQSYFTSDKTVYINKYEVSIYDVENEKEYVYDIDENSDGVVVDETTHKITYTLPYQLDIDGSNIIIEDDKEYRIKVRARSNGVEVVNGSFTSVGQSETYLTIKRAKGISSIEGKDLRVENGILKWQVLDPTKHKETIISVYYYENKQIKYLKPLIISNASKNDGVYSYHYYEFADLKYDLETTGSVYITDGIEYYATVYVVGKSEEGYAILNSNKSNTLKFTRLEPVITDTIKTVDGILTWDAVEDAIAYKVTVGGQTVTTDVNRFDVSTLGLSAGNYSVAVRALGSDRANSMLSTSVSVFNQLNKVDSTTINISGGEIVWDAVENAQGYLVDFSYTDNEGNSQEISSVVTDNRFNIYEDIKDVEVVINGRFTVAIAAVGFGEGFVFNGEKSDEYESSTDAPSAAISFAFDETNNRLVVKLARETFLASDTIVIQYYFHKYTAQDYADSLLSSDYVAPQGSLERKTITYQQSGMYEYVDASTVNYYYPLTVIGQYSYITVHIERPSALPTNTISTEDVKFNLFAYGSGVENDEYMIDNSTHLLNISYFPSANYKLISSINMEGVDVNDRLSKHNAVIAKEFRGVLDGNNKSIYSFNQGAESKTIELNDVAQFALFEQIIGDAATKKGVIKNLQIGGSENNSLILINTFANKTSSVIKLSMIATGANGATLENIQLMNFKVVIKQSTTKTAGTIFVGGFVTEMTNSTIKNSTVNVEVNLDLTLSSDVETYVGGVAAKATTSNIDETTIKFTISSKASNLLSFVGGAVADYAGTTSRTTGITNSTVAFNASNIKATYLGGLVGFANNINVNQVKTTGLYQKSDINYNTHVGGVVGYARSSIIQNSGSTMDLVVSVSNISGQKCFGYIVGGMYVFNDISCEITNCYSDKYVEDQEQTTVSTSSVVVGMYGYGSGSGVIVSGCYKYEEQ